MKTQNIQNNYFKHYEKGLDYFIYQNNPDRAITELKKAIELNPAYSQAYYDLAYIYKLINHPKSSAKYFIGYLKLNPAAKDRNEVLNIISLLTYKTKYQYCMAS